MTRYEPVRLVETSHSMTVTTLANSGSGDGSMFLLVRRSLKRQLYLGTS